MGHLSKRNQPIDGISRSGKRTQKLNGSEQFYVSQGGAGGTASAQDIADFVASALGSSLSSITAPTGQTLTVAQVASGAQDIFINRSGPTAAFTDTTPTAAQIISSMKAALGQNLPIGYGWFMQITNASGFTETLAGGSGVVINGTATIATATSRGFFVTITGAATVTMTNVGSGGA